MSIVDMLTVREQCSVAEGPWRQCAFEILANHKYVCGVFNIGIEWELCGSP